LPLCGLPNDAFPAPGNTLAEFEEFEDGARVGYDPVAHALTAILPAGGTALIEAPAGVTIRGDVAIEGNVTLTGGMTATADIVAAGVSVSDHDHGGVQAGGANTLKPNPA
jgi:phage baseplate assembly protein V